MSVKAMSWAWDQKGLSEGEKLLLMALADHADDDGICWPGQKRLAEKVGCTDRTIRTRLTRMETEGLIRRERRKTQSGFRSSDRIFLHLPNSRLPENISGRDDGLPETAASALVEPSVSVVTPLGNDDSIEKKEAPPALTVDKLKVTAHEWQLANGIIATFNKQAGTKFALRGSRGRPTEHLKRILRRVRDNPELSLLDHRELIVRICANPWWKGKPGGVGVIYGPAAFGRCLATDDRPTHGRSFRDERRTSTEDAPW